MGDFARVIAKYGIALGVVAMGVAAVASPARPPAPGVHAWTNSVPRAFLKDRHLRLYSGADGERVLFKAGWQKSRAAAQDYSYSGKTLEIDTAPPALPEASSSWREIKVLDLAQGDRLRRALAAHLAPAEPGHGVYVQYALGDIAIFRDTTGEVKLVPFDDRPGNLTIDQRYSRHELSSAVASLLAKELRAGYPDETAFVLLWRHDGHVRITFVDLKERETLVLFPPAVDTDRGSSKLGGNLKTLTSFALVDNLWAFLKNPVSSTTRTIHQGVQWTGTLFERRLRDRASAIPPVTNAPGMDLIAWEKWLDKHTDMPRERGSIRLLINGENFYPEFEWRVSEARSKIDIHVCIY